MREKSDRSLASALISRRQFGETLAMFVAATLTGEFVGRELSIVRDGKFVVNGITYHPTYEYHPDGPQLALSPQDNGVFVEYISNLYTGIEVAPHQIALVRGDQFSESPWSIQENMDGASSGKATMMETIIANNIALAIGDIGLMDPEFIAALNKTISDEDKTNYYAGLVAACVSQIPTLTLILAQQHKNYPRWSRRRFVYTAGVSAVAVGGAAAGFWKTTSTEWFWEQTVMPELERLAQQNDPSARLALRAYGLASHLHPENPLISIRNMVMALKIQEFGAYFQSLGMLYPQIAYDVGADHTGTEDYLCLPPELLYFLLSTVGKIYLNRAYQTYGERVGDTKIFRPGTDNFLCLQTTLHDKTLVALARG